MKKTEKILWIDKKMKIDIQDGIFREFYTFETYGISGYNIYTDISIQRFDKIPESGDWIKCIADIFALNNLNTQYWKVIKRLERTI